VSVGAARKLNKTAAKYPNLKFGIVYQNRMNPIYRKMRELIASGELGEVTRVTWLITDWFRTWTYYASGGWRATWLGEGAACSSTSARTTLICCSGSPASLPNRVTAVVSLGKTHPIEVEDEVSAILEYPNGAIGHFCHQQRRSPRHQSLGKSAASGQAHQRTRQTHLRPHAAERPRAARNQPARVRQHENWTIDLSVGKSEFGDMHKAVTEKFAAAILRNEPLVAEGTERRKRTGNRQRNAA